MDIKKLSDLIVNREELKDIPATVILRVAVSVIEIINSGECFKETESCI